jgi:hypothetical protein
MVDMDTNNRTDIHRPSVIKPEGYTFVAFDYIGSSDLGAILMLQSQRELFRAHMASTGGRYSTHEHGGSCYVCGAFACYLCIWHHAESNTYIQTGEDCAQKMDMSYGDMNGFRRGIANAREAQAGKKKAILVLGDLGLMTAWEIYTAEYPKHTAECREQGAVNGENTVNFACTCDQVTRAQAFDQYEERTIRDMVSRLVKYGSMSDKTVTFMKALFAKILQRPIIAAQRAAEQEAAAPVPTGRVIITGRVLAVKQVERQSYSYGDSGMSTKLLIQGLTGFKVWGNQFMNAQKGDLITFTATIQPSEKDTKFGFFSRPTKGSFVNAKTGEVIPDFPQGYETKEFPTQEDLVKAINQRQELYGAVKSTQEAL